MQSTNTYSHPNQRGQKNIFKGNVNVIHNYNITEQHKKSRFEAFGDKMKDSTSHLGKYRMKKVTCMAGALDDCTFYEENKNSSRIF